MDQEDMVAKLDAILVRLSAPVSTVEAAEGWTAESKSAMTNFFERMRADVIRGLDVRSNPAYVSVTRGLDHWGIASGGLFEAAAAISSLARAR
jgi:hypothetical protein